MLILKTCRLYLADNRKVNMSRMKKNYILYARRDEYSANSHGRWQLSSVKLTITCHRFYVMVRVLFCVSFDFFSSLKFLLLHYVHWRVRAVLFDNVRANILLFHNVCRAFNWKMRSNIINSFYDNFHYTKLITYSFFGKFLNFFVAFHNILKGLNKIF